MSCQELDLNKYYETYIFSENRKNEKIDKTYKVRSVISHFNDSFWPVFPMIPLKAFMSAWSDLREDQA